MLHDVDISHDNETIHKGLVKNIARKVKDVLLIQGIWPTVAHHSPRSLSFLIPPLLSCPSEVNPNGSPKA
jgi:hypothetical protein